MSLTDPRDMVSVEQEALIESIFRTLDMEKDYFDRIVSPAVMATHGLALRDSIRSMGNSIEVFTMLSENMPWAEALYVLGDESMSGSSSAVSVPSPSSASTATASVDDGSGAAPFKLPAKLPMDDIDDEKKLNFVIYTFRSTADDEVFVVRIKGEVDGFIRHGFDHTKYSPAHVLKISLAADAGVNPYSLGFTDSDDLPANVVALPRYTAAASAGGRAFHHPFLINVPSRLRIVPPNLSKYTDTFWRDDVLVEGQDGLHSSGNGYVKAALKGGVPPTVPKPKAPRGGFGFGRGAHAPARGAPANRGGPSGRGAPRGRGFGKLR